MRCPTTEECPVQGWKGITLFLFIFLKCMHSSHLFQCLRSEVFLDLYLEVDVSVTRNMP